MANSNENYYYTYTLISCSLCHESIDVEDVDSFLAVSCASGPSSAKWMVLEGTRYLCIGRAAATTVQTSDQPPGVYLVHPYCNGIMPPESSCRRSLFDCIRDLGPILNEPIKPRDWPWRKSSTVYAPALRAIISGSTEFGTVKQVVELRSREFERIRQKLPRELFEMILQWLPLELALVLDCVSAKDIPSTSLRRLRHDPVASRLERAFHVFGHPKRQLQFGKVELEQEMVAQFVKIGGQWYLQGLHSNTKQGGVGQKQIIFQHDSNRDPYISVQVNGFGITHIAFDMDARKPRWISPNAANKHINCFQDRGNVQGYRTIFVVSDGIKLSTVDIRDLSCPRARAILPIETSTCYWSLTPSTLQYVCPTIVDLTKKTIYAWIPSPGQPGLRFSNEPEPGLRVLRFRSSGWRVAKFLQSSAAFVHFLDEEDSNLESDSAFESLRRVVAFWRYGLAGNFVLAE